MSRVVVTAGCSVLLALAGCSASGVPTVPVSGRVTLDGKPLGDVAIVFVPVSEGSKSLNVGPGSMARADANGRFVLQTTDGREGAVVATHIVRISPAVNSTGVDVDTPPPLSTTQRLPRSAEDGSIRYRVPADGTDAANFDLKSN